MPQHPKVSVVMPAFNTERYIAEAIESILNQTFTDFEFIIINDGSTDHTEEILASYRALDARICVQTQANSGVASSMNVGCGLARGKYIARMDSDDVSLPTRLERQVEFLDSHPNIGLCGTWIRVFSESDDRMLSYPVDADVALCSMPFQMPFAGGSVMFLRSLFSENGLRFNPHVGATDDYLFAVECSKTCGVSSIPEVLFRYRRHSSQITKVEEDRQNLFAQQIRKQQLEAMGIEFSEDEIALHERVSTWQVEGDKQWLKKIEQWLVKLKSTNLKSEKYPKRAFAKLLSDYWFSACTRNANLGLWTFRTFLDSPLVADVPPETGRKLKFLLKCAFHTVR